MVIQTIGSSEGEGAVVERDPWIALSIEWLPRPHGQPLYVRASGTRGGELELKVDPSTGLLVKAVVIEAPPTVEAPRASSGVSVQECSVPILDPILWQGAGLQDLSAENLAGKVVSCTMDLGFWETGSEVGLIFEDSVPDRYLSCGGVQVGVSVSGSIVEIRTQAD